MRTNPDKKLYLPHLYRQLVSYLMPDSTCMYAVGSNVLFHVQPECGRLGGINSIRCTRSTFALILPGRREMWYLTVMFFLLFINENASRPCFRLATSVKSGGVFTWFCCKKYCWRRVRIHPRPVRYRAAVLPNLFYPVVVEDIPDSQSFGFTHVRYPALPSVL